MKTVIITSSLITFHDRGQPVLSTTVEVLAPPTRHLVITAITCWTVGDRAFGGAWLVDIIGMIEQRHRVAQMGTTAGLTPTKP